MRVSLLFGLLLSLFPVLHANAASSDRVTPRIYNGNPAASIPSYMVWINVIPDGGNSYIACGASLISPRWLLTAAHCVDSDNFTSFDTHSIRAVMGNTDVSSSDVDVVSVDRVIIHPDYTLGTQAKVVRNDVALLHLSEEVDYQPITLLSTSQLADMNTGDEVTAYGWGWATVSGPSTNILQTVNLDFAPYGVCDASWGGALWDENVCAIDANAGICRGDSGGPLIVHLNGQDRLLGISSVGRVVDVDDPNAACDPGAYDVFASAAHYYSWAAGIVGFYQLSGTKDFGYLGNALDYVENYTLTNTTSDTVTFTALEILNDDDSVFSLSNNTCVATLAAGESCEFTLTLSSADPREVNVELRLSRDNGDPISYNLSAIFLDSLNVQNSLRINGAQWFTGGDGGWAEGSRLGGDNKPGFSSSRDSEGESILFAQISGPFEMRFDGRSETSAVFDGVDIQIDGKSVKWVRLDGQTDTFHIKIPKGDHRLAFIYDKSESEGSRVSLYNFRKGGEPKTDVEDNNDDSDGGSLGLGVLLMLSIIGVRKLRR